MSIRIRCLFLVPLAVAAALLGAVRPASAAFSANTTAALNVTSATLAPPTRLTATTSCRSFGGSTVKLTWTATASTYATGYTAYLSANGGNLQAVSGSISGTATSTTIAITNRVSYTVTLSSTYRSWSSAASASTGTVLCP